MNKRELNKKRRETYNKYHTPSCGNLIKRKQNAIFLSPANSWEHEQAKAKVCYDLLKNKEKFITESVRNAKDQNGKYRRVDVINLDSGQEIEIETTPVRAIRFYGEENVVIVPVGWSFKDKKWLELKAKKGSD